MLASVIIEVEEFQIARSGCGHGRGVVEGAELF